MYGLFIIVGLLIWMADYFDLFFIQLILLIAVGAIALWAQFNRLKQLRMSQMVGIGVYVIAIILGTASLFYFLYRPMLAYISIGWMRIIFTWIVLIGTLYAVGQLLHYGVKRVAHKDESL